MPTSVQRNIGLTNQLQSLRDIRYSARDFASLKLEMNERIANYFPESGIDFSEGSPAQVLVELMAYCSDVLNFYLDKQFNELFLDRVFEAKNAYSLAKGLGYQPRPVRPSVANLSVQIDLPVTGSLTAMYHFTIESSTRFLSKSPASVTFENVQPIVFNTQTANSFTPTVLVRGDGQTVTRLTRSDVRVIAGETKTFAHYFDNTNGIKSVHIPENENVNDVISVVDSDGNEWYKVRNLSQEYIFTSIPNFDGSDVTDVPFILTIKRVPRRFTVENNPDGSIDLVFGSGDIDLTDTETILSPDNFIFPNKTQGKFNNFTADSVQLEDLLNTTSLGVSPRNVTVLIKYRTGGGLITNVGANFITRFENLDLQFYSSNVNNNAINFIKDSFTITNPEPAQGGSDAETIEQIRVNASFNYAAQDRVVSITDYVARVSSMPLEFGSVYKLIARQAKDQSFDTLNQLTSKITQLVNQRKSITEDEVLKQEIINLNEKVKNTNADVKIYAICRDSNGYLQKPTTTLKKNVLTYINQYKIISDVVEIDDVNIINLGCKITLNTDVKRNNPSEILLNAFNMLKEYMKIDNMNIGSEINLDDVRVRLRNLKGVISIPEIEFVLLTGTTITGRIYSNDYYGTDISTLYNHNRTILTAPAQAIFEVKYLNDDIVMKFDA